MTAVAAPPAFPPISRNGWPSSNGASNSLNGSINGDDVSRMLVPRKTAQRQNSSSSLSSTNSSTSTMISGSVLPSGAPNSVNGDWASRKRPSRGLWPSSKTEPVSGLSIARPQSITSANSSASAASGLSALQTPLGLGPPVSGNMASQLQVNGHPRGPQINPDTPALFLTPMNGTFERKTIAVPFYPDVLRIGRQTNGKTVPTAYNGYFDSKVLSRQHAEVWANRQGQVYIRDVKSSNGTFVNGQRLSQENKDSEPHELRDQDMVELGIDIVSEDQKTIVHHKVAARVEHAGFYGGGNNNLLDLNFNDMDPNSSQGLLGVTLGQGAGQLRRSSSQSSNGSLRGPPSIASSNISSFTQPRQNHFWLTPVNMDQIVKKLNAEYKAAKQQSVDLQRASQYIENLLTTSTQHVQQSRKESKDKTRSMSVRDSFKARFSDPPAPPPAAPLPEKPDVASPGGSARDHTMHGFLRRSDTAKAPISSGSGFSVKSTLPDLGNAAQIASLSEALNEARREFESQSLRLKEVEDQLMQEKLRREDAEDRATRLENERQGVMSESVLPSAHRSLGDANDKTIVQSRASVAPADKLSPLSSEHLQQRLDLLVMEFSEVKQAAERWRIEKKQAETERDEALKDRQSLAEMVERLRTEAEEEATKVAKKRQRRQRSGSSQSPTKDKESRHAGLLEQSDTATMDEEDEDTENEKSTKDQEQNSPNGHLAHAHDVTGKELQDTMALVGKPSQLVQSAPVLSAVSVVLIGVAIMTLINKMQKGES